MNFRMAMKNRLVVTLKNNLAEIKRLAHRIDKFGEDRGLSSDTLYAVNLALDEVITNIILYGYDDRRKHTIRVQLQLQADDLKIEVEDDGRSFNPLKMPEFDATKPLEKRAIGGIGISLVRKMMDQLEYRRQQNKNLLVMKRKVMPNQLLRGHLKAGKHTLK